MIDHISLIYTLNLKNVHGNYLSFYFSLDTILITLLCAFNLSTIILHENYINLTYLKNICFKYVIKLVGHVKSNRNRGGSNYI